MMAKKKAVPQGTQRQWTTDYGVTKGHCVTPAGAKRSVLKYMQENNLRHCNIEDRFTGKKVADCWLSGVWGFMVVPVGRRENVIKLVVKAKP